MSFEKLVICFTGLSLELKEEKSKLVLEMGGNVSPNLNNLVTHLVAIECDPNSKKYSEARRFKLPVMRVEWIDDGYKAMQAQNNLLMSLPAVVERYRCPIFTNCVITVTGFTIEDRANIGRLIELHGGTFDGEMSRRHCTHLIAASNSGEKYRKAMEWHIRIVSAKWLRKSIECGYRLPEKGYTLAPQIPIATPSSVTVRAPKPSAAKQIKFEEEQEEKKQKLAVAKRN